MDITELERPMHVRPDATSFMACGIGRGDIPMQEYDLYINPQKPSVGLYVHKGAGLPDLADPKEWVFDGTAAQVELPPDLVKGIETNGHAFRDMD